MGDGDEEAFSAVYDQLAPVIFGTVKRVLRDHAMSEEVTQEVLVEMWSAVHKFDPDRASVTLWAVTIARRRAVDRVRKEQSQRTRIESLSQQRQDNGADPSDEVAETAGAQHVRRAIERLAARQCVPKVTPVSRTIGYCGPWRIGDGRLSRLELTSEALPLALTP